MKGGASSAKGFVDLDRFRAELAELTISHYWSSWGLDLVEQSPHVVESFRGDKRSYEELLKLPTDELVSSAEDLQAAQSQAREINLRNRNILARAVYVYAWGAFELLVRQVLRATYLQAPQRLIEALDLKVRRVGDSFLRHFLSEDWDRHRALVAIIEPEVARACDLGPRKLAGYWKRHLGISWPKWLLDELQLACDRRNAAAHHIPFETPLPEELEEDLQRIIYAGEWIAMKSARRHNIRIRRTAGRLSHRRPASTRVETV